MNYRHIDVRPISGALGAEIHNLDLSCKITEDTVKEIKKAYLKYSVLMFRNQKISESQLIDFAKLFGPIHVGGIINANSQNPYIAVLDHKEDVPKGTANPGGSWHVDQAQRENPELGYVMYCEEAPPYGGDTMFSSLYLAYEALSDKLKSICDDLTVIHSASGLYGTDADGTGGIRPLRDLARVTDINLSDEFIRGLTKETEHPLVCVHPETNRKVLFVTGHYCIRFSGMTAEESRPLLNYLNQHATKPEFTCRFRWEKGSLLVMDNRCTQHYAINDYFGYRRRMLRIEIDGDCPRGVGKSK